MSKVLGDRYYVNRISKGVRSEYNSSVVVDTYIQDGFVCVSFSRPVEVIKMSWDVSVDLSKNLYNTRRSMGKDRIKGDR